MTKQVFSRVSQPQRKWIAPRYFPPLQ